MAATLRDRWFAVTTYLYRIDALPHHALPHHAQRPMPDTHIIAIGGGGFTMEHARTLDDYVLDQSRADRPSVCFVPTASGDAPAYTVRFYDAFRDRDCRATHLTLFSRSVRDLRDYVLDQDVIYVGGGNTASMLGVWREHGLDEVFAEAYREGVVLAGVSAGAMCWFDGGVTDSFGPGLTPYRGGLSLVEGSFCPHFDSEPRRQDDFPRYVERESTFGYALEDGVAMHVRNGEVHRCVASRPSRQAWLYDARSGNLTESEMEVG